MAQTIVIFEISGPFAHFRKFYTNSSSLTYGFPPRTVLMGMVAAILGWERDSYYERLGVEKAQFAVVPLGNPRRLVATVNYIRTKEEDVKKLMELKPFTGTQVPLEVLRPGYGEKRVVYRIYFSHHDPGINNQLAERIAEGRFYYPLYMGLSEFIAECSFVGISEPTVVHQPGQEVVLHSVVNTALIEEPVLEGSVKLIREKAPVAFGTGRARMPNASFIYAAQSKPTVVDSASGGIKGKESGYPQSRGAVKMRLRVPAYSFALNGDTVVFMEG
ncbi:MAG: type I-B CRISPR-associated protein Cas5 [Syntrophomonadaceae bacterium]|nr:type I-B CRISPR-associated protein Cas5 [Syntrophomonadaceae bacterium]